MISSTCLQEPRIHENWLKSGSNDLSQKFWLKWANRVRPSPYISSIMAFHDADFISHELLNNSACNKIKIRFV